MEVKNDAGGIEIDPTYASRTSCQADMMNIEPMRATLWLKSIAHVIYWTMDMDARLGVVGVWREKRH